jgi:phage protein D
VSSVAHYKYRKGTKYKVSFPTLPSLTSQPAKIELIQKQYMHDVAIFEFTRVSSLWFETIKTGLLVEFSWVQETQKRTWLGYVSAIDKVATSQRQTAMRLHCVGSTFPLKQRDTAVFSNVTIPQVVSSIVNSFGFKYIGQEDSRIFETLSMAGHSYWEWIQELAKKIGYGVVVDGTNFIFKPIDEIISMGFSQAPVMSLESSTIPKNNQFLDRTLDSIKVINGEHIEDGLELRTNKTAGGVDPKTGTAFVARKSPGDTGIGLRKNISDVIFNDFKTSEVAHSPSSAMSIVEGLSTLSKFNLPAIITGQGDPRLRPFGTVIVTGTGSSTDGHWLIKEVKHSFSQVGEYQVEIKALSDGLGETVEYSFRKRDASLAGTVNLKDAIKNGGKQATSYSRSTTRVSTQKNVIKVGNQGYKRTPSSWIAK